jgi:hypothetical protein
LDSLLDHFVGASEQRWWHFEAESLDGSQVNDEMEFGRLPHGKVGRLLHAQPKSCIAYSKTPHHEALTLGVVKTNPALGLYERLGFRITHEDERKFYMRHDCRLP